MRDGFLEAYESGGIDEAEERMLKLLGWLESRNPRNGEYFEASADEQAALVAAFPAGLTRRDQEMLAYLYEVAYNVASERGLPVGFTPDERSAFLDHPISWLLPEESLPWLGWYRPEVLNFYWHWGSAGGLPVLGTAAISPEAFEWARAVYERLIGTMTACRPEALAALAGVGARIIAMSPDDLVTSFPETQGYAGEFDEGLAAPVEEAAGLAGYETMSGSFIVTPAFDDWEGRWVGEVFIHELAHMLLFHVLSEDEAARVIDLYDAAHAAGTWYGYYADTEPAEYFADMSVYYLNAGIEGIGRDYMASVDPAMHEFLGTVYCP